MEKKEFVFQGLDAKTELKTALLLIIPALLIMSSVLFISHIFFPNLYFLVPLLLAAILTVSLSVLILNQLSKRIKDKNWIIIIENENIDIKFRDSHYALKLSDILMIKNLGQPGLRYLTIKTRNDVIKIRVGNTGLAPFSKEEDIEIIDSFIEYLKPYIIENFNKKILKNIININIIPNFGVFINKKEKIKYTIINKMEPWQVMVFILGITTVVLILFVIVMEKIYF